MSAIKLENYQDNLVGFRSMLMYKNGSDQWQKGWLTLWYTQVACREAQKQAKQNNWQEWRFEKYGNA